MNFDHSALSIKRTENIALWNGNQRLNNEFGQWYIEILTTTKQEQRQIAKNVYWNKMCWTFDIQWYTSNIAFEMG